jgi:hypothetical protein
LQGVVSAGSHVDQSVRRRGTRRPFLTALPAFLHAAHELVI